MTAKRKSSFAPVYDADTQVLILGSLPGDASLKAGQYYGHPQNAFWRLVEHAIGCDLVTLPYIERLKALKAARIGLWDVIASAERPGSLDQRISAPETADLRTLVAGMPDLKLIAFNGKTASRIGRRSLDGTTDIDLTDLPSSSPAHAAMSFADKARVWAVIGEPLRVNHFPKPNS